jgi:predicted nucleic acid-binding protein
MIDKIFLDSNLWIYLYAKNPPEKSQQVAEIIKHNSSSLLVSTQVLGELFHVLTRKKFTTKTDAITKHDLISKTVLLFVQCRKWFSMLRDFFLKF